MIDRNLIGSNDEERLLISRAADLSAESENRAVASSFLTPGEQRIVYSYATGAGVADRLFLWGGCPGCERRRAVFLPGWLSLDTPCKEGVFSAEREKHFLRGLEAFGSAEIASEFTCPVRLAGSGYRTLSHRDWLGALMSLGIKRECVGDIAVQSTKEAVVFLDRVAAGFVAAELKKAGSDTVSAGAFTLPEGFSVGASFERVTSTVATPRVDGVVRALCQVSRENAASLVSSGLVEVNYFTEESPARHVGAGDILSIRGYGKFVIVSAEDPTRRGRIRLVADKYV